MWGSSSNSKRAARSAGFSLVEMLIILGIIMTLSAMAIPKLVSAIDHARYARAVADLRTLEEEITLHEVTTDQLPLALDDIGRANLLDPWKTPYQYLSFSTTSGKGAWRKDRFLVPINSTYDLYSMGKDKKSKPPLTAKDSHDDIIRANDGAFIGLAEAY